MKLNVGLLATTVSIISFLPVIYRMSKTKDSSNFTYPNLGLAILANVLWISYGLHSQDAKANVVSGFIFLTLYTYILYVKYMNTEKKN